MRGRLIFQFLAEIAPLDTEAIETGGYYDGVFRAVRKVDTDGDGIGETQRQEKTHVEIPVQVEDRSYSEQNQSSLGDVPEHDMVLVMHFKDLERLGMIDTDGTAQIRKGDRLVALKDRRGNLVQAIETPPGLYVVEARPVSWGLNLSFPRRNILLVFLGDRAEGMTRA